MLKQSSNKELGIHCLKCQAVLMNMCRGVFCQWSIYYILKWQNILHNDDSQFSMPGLTVILCLQILAKGCLPQRMHLFNKKVWMRTETKVKRINLIKIELPRISYLLLYLKLDCFNFFRFPRWILQKYFLTKLNFSLRLTGQFRMPCFKCLFFAFSSGKFLDAWKSAYVNHFMGHFHFNGA